MPSPSVIPLLSLLRLEGPDCATFLQGYVTTDIDNADDSWSLSAFTNLKGRVVATVLLRRADREQIELIVSTDIADGLASFLAKYLMFAKCELHVVDSSLCLTGASTDSTSEPNPNAFALPEGLCHEDSGATHLRPLEATSDTTAEQNDASDQWLGMLISAKIGWVGAQASEQHLPQMLGLLMHDAVSFSKGCYLGQEIVARVEHRGAVKRHLVALDYTLEGDTPAPTIGTALRSDGDRDVGNLVLVRPSARQALAVVALDASSLSSEQPAIRYAPIG